MVLVKKKETVLENGPPKKQKCHMKKHTETVKEKMLRGVKVSKKWIGCVTLFSLLV